MLIDLILDRTTQTAYNAKQFYLDCMEYGADEVTSAMDDSDNKAVQKALIKYIIDNDYNPDIIAYINAVDWICNRTSHKTMDKYLIVFSKPTSIGIIDMYLNKARQDLTDIQLFELLAVAKINCRFTVDLDTLVIPL